jgi:hypothetical protein
VSDALALIACVMPVTCRTLAFSIHPSGMSSGVSVEAAEPERRYTNSLVAPYRMM